MKKAPVGTVVLAPRQSLQSLQMYTFGGLSGDDIEIGSTIVKTDVAGNGGTQIGREVFGEFFGA